ncbi:MAG TPA: PqqD family protein [Mycobacteriales bacterium]|nr:PqqD family protein [Mycobacteriales bacterium]
MTAAHRGTARLREGGLSSCSVGGELVVLDLDSSQYLTIRGSGVYLFELLGVARHRDDLVAALLARFEVDECTARADVDRFLADLAEAGLLA